jgi:hypothetical protein
MFPFSEISRLPLVLYLTLVFIYYNANIWSLLLTFHCSNSYSKFSLFGLHKIGYLGKDLIMFTRCVHTF